MASRLALVTGANGFVGCYVVRALLARGTAVRAMVRKGADLRALEGLPCEFAWGDLRDADAVEQATRACDEVYHVAADYRLWVPDPAAMFRANVDGTSALMYAALAAGVERIVYTSSVATLGILSGGIADEETPSAYGDMIGPYKQSKFAAEEAVHALIAERGLPAVIVNPSTPIGPGDVKPTPTGRVIVEAARGKMPGYVDTGLNIVHVDDVAAGQLLAAEHGVVGERYILGGDNMSLADILAVVARVVGRRPPMMKIPYAVVLSIAAGAELMARVTGREPFTTLDGVRMSRKKMYFSSAKAMCDLGYAPRPAREAIADAVAWFEANGYLT